MYLFKNQLHQLNKIIYSFKNTWTIIVYFKLLFLWTCKNSYEITFYYFKGTKKKKNYHIDNN